MLELWQVPTEVIGCYGDASALDRVDANGLSVRVASDELLLLGDGDRLQELRAELARLDPSSAVVDLTSAYSVWALGGDDREEAFRRLSAVPLPEPPGVAQGLVANLAAKVLVQLDELVLVVPSVVSHHLHARVLGACADLATVEPVAAERAAV